MIFRKLSRDVDCYMREYLVSEFTLIALTASHTFYLVENNNLITPTLSIQNASR